MNSFGSPLHLAAVGGHLEKFQIEIINPANNLGEPPPHSTAISGHLGKSQVEKPNDNYGKPPLHLAADSGQSKVSKYTSIKTLTLNVSGLKSYGRIDQVRNLLIKHKIDVAVLTETEISHDSKRSLSYSRGSKYETFA